MDNMSTNYSYKELFELAIEWAIRKNPDAFLISNLSTRSLEDLSMFIANDLDMSSFDATVSPHVDLKHFVERADKEEERASDILPNILGAAMNSKTTREAIHQLMVNEMEALGLTKHLDPQKLDFAKKALAIAQARMVQKHSALTIEDLNISELFGGRKYDFAIELNTLRAGYGANRDKYRLFFDFKVQFWSFLDALQENTALSVIPPLDQREMYGVGSEDDYLDFAAFENTPSKNTPSKNGPFKNTPSKGMPSKSTLPKHTPSKNTPSKDTPSKYSPFKFPLKSTYFDNSPSEKGNTRIVPVFGGSETTMKAALEDKEKHEARKGRGYTLEHGPWLWSKVIKKEQSWEKITDLQSFQRMIYHAANDLTKPGGDPPAIFMVHSLDKVAIDQQKEIDSLQRRAERRYQNEMKEMGFSDDEIGNSGMDWLRKDCAKDRKKREKERVDRL